MRAHTNNQSPGIITRWHESLALAKHDRQWHQKDVLGEYREMVSACNTNSDSLKQCGSGSGTQSQSGSGLIARWSELADVAFTLSRARAAGHRVRLPTPRRSHGNQSANDVAPKQHEKQGIGDACLLLGILYMLPKYSLRFAFYRAIIRDMRMRCWQAYPEDVTIDKHKDKDNRVSPLTLPGVECGKAPNPKVCQCPACLARVESVSEPSSDTLHTATMTASASRDIDAPPAPVNHRRHRDIVTIRTCQRDVETTSCASANVPSSANNPATTASPLCWIPTGARAVALPSFPSSIPAFVCPLSCDVREVRNPDKPNKRKEIAAKYGLSLEAFEHSYHRVRPRWWLLP